MRVVWIVISVFMVIVLMGGLSSCATSSGPLYEESVASKNSADNGSDDTERDDSVSEEEIGVYIETEPAEAEILINKANKGESPLFIDDLEEGEYSVTVRKEGYKTIQEWVEFDGDTRLELSFTLEMLTGYLDVSTKPPDALVYIDGEIYDTFPTELASGTHTVRTARFGYTEQKQQVAIVTDETTELYVELGPAPFSLYDEAISRELFNPNNPGTLGTTSITFSVSAPGEGELSIYNQDGDVVMRHDFPQFVSWEQSFRWDGTGQTGSTVPDGEYRIVITAEQEVRRELSVTVDRTAVISYRSVWSGSSGLLYTPSADVLPVNTFQLSSIFLGHIEEIENDLSARFPTQIGFRYTVAKNLELTGQGTVILQSKGTSPFSLGMAGKYQLLRTAGENRVSIGTIAKATYLSGETLDTQTNYTGFSLGVPVQLTLGIFHAILMPEIVVSSEEISYNLPSDTGFYSWGYGRIGFLLDFSTVSTGLSAAFRTKSFTRGFDLQFPFSAGWELHWFIPKTQMVLSAGVAGEFAPTEQADAVDPYPGFYLMTGIGLGFIN
jgi:hypothetical protein